MKQSVFAALFAALSALAAPVLAQGTGLDRLTLRSDLVGWEAIGRIDMANAYCTGVLIASDLVLTAAHCVYDKSTGKARAPETMTFRAGVRDGNSVAESGVLHAVAHPGYDPRAKISQDTIRHDVALLQLSRTIPAMTAAPFALFDGAPAKGEVNVVSYGRGRDDAPSWQRACNLLDRGQGLMAFDCNVTYGSSGAPVFMKQGNRMRILSLVSAGLVDQGERLSFGMDLPGAVSELKARLRAAPSRSLTGSLNEGAKRITVGAGGGALNSGTSAKFIRPGG